MYSLAHTSAVLQCLIDIANEGSDILSSTLLKDIEDQYTYLPYIKPNSNFEISNNLMKWTDKSPSNISWIITHNFLSQCISKESLHKKQETYKVIFKVKHQNIQKVTSFDPVRNRNLVLTAHCLREGYSVKGGSGRLKVLCPSGNIRYVTRTECGCNEFNKELRRQSPCIHLRMANTFLDYPSAFKNSTM